MYCSRISKAIYSMQQKDSDRYQRNLKLQLVRFQDSTVIHEVWVRPGPKHVPFSFWTHSSQCWQVDSVFFNFPCLSRSSDILSLSKKDPSAQGSTSLGFWCPPNQRVLYACITLEYTRRPVLWRAGSFISVIKQTEMYWMRRSRAASPSFWRYLLFLLTSPRERPGYKY